MSLIDSSKTRCSGTVQVSVDPVVLLGKLWTTRESDEFTSRTSLRLYGSGSVVEAPSAAVL